MKKVLLILLTISISLFAVSTIDSSTLGDVKLTKEEKTWLKDNPIIKVASMTYWNHDGKDNTIHSDYLKLLNKYGNLNIIPTKHDTWEDGYNQAISGKNDIHAIMNLSWSKEREEKYFLYTKSYNFEPNYLIVRKQNHNINNLQDLRKKTVIVKEKSITYNILKEISTNIDIIFVKSDIMMYKRLFEDKNTDALITYKKDADLLKKYNLKVVRTIYDKFSEVSIGVNKKYPYLQSIINKVHKAIPNDELFNLRNKIYNTKPYKGQINTQNQDKKLINLTSEEKNYLKNKKEIKICLDPNWMPFEKLNEDGKHIGISSDYFKIFEKELNIPITPIKTKSWTQTLEFAKNRKCDILTLGNETPKRKKYLNFTQPYLQIPFVMVTKNNVPFFNNFKYLKNEKIGVVKNSSLEETLKTKYPNLNLVKVKSNQDGLEKLQNNELFGYIGNMLSIGHILKKDFIQELKIINKLDDETSNLAIGVRNDDDILYGIFQKLVANIDSDTKNKILNKYIFIKYEQSIHYKYLKEILAVVFLIIIIFLYIQYRLNKLNLELETKVSKKTSDLKYLNENLESKVKEQTFLLQQQNEKLKEAQSIAKIGSWSLDLSKNKLIWSDEIFNIFEIDKDKFEASYEGFISSIHPEDREMVHNTYTESLETKSPYSIKHRLLMNDGRIKWVIENCKTTFDDGQPQLSIGTIQDITKEYEIDIQLKNKEKQLYESEKMASLGEMIGNIAHQWRQPLSAISTAASGIQISKEYNTLTKEKEDELLKSIIDNTQYLSNTIDTFRDYIKEGKKLKEVILQDILNNAINITEASLKNNHIKLINNINSVEPIRITMVIKELPQVIINLINNAKDILIENNIDDKIITIDLIKKEDNIIISVEDNGGGVPNNIIDKIFEPYFTTKHKSQGTGLGLHMSYKIITESLDGRLWAQNTKNGAKFFIELPINTQ